MTPAKLLDLSLRLSNFQTSDSAKRSRILDWMNVAKQEIINWEGVTWDFLFQIYSLSVTSALGSTYGLNSLAQDVVSFWNVTQNWPMEKIPHEWIQKYETDEDQTGSPNKWTILGWDSTNSAWSVRVHPTPDASETIKYSAYSYVADFTDTTSSTLQALGWPRKAEPALLRRTTQLMLEDEGMEEDALSQERAFEKAMEALVRSNRQISNLSFDLGQGLNQNSILDVQVDSMETGGHVSTVL